MTETKWFKHRGCISPRKIHGTVRAVNNYGPLFDWWDVDRECRVPDVDWRIYCRVDSLDFDLVPHDLLVDIEVVTEIAEVDGERVPVTEWRTYELEYACLGWQRQTELPPIVMWTDGPVSADLPEWNPEDWNKLRGL